MVDIADIGCADAARQVIARGGRIMKIVAAGDIVERGQLLLRVKKAVQGRICRTYNGFAL